MERDLPDRDDRSPRSGRTAMETTRLDGAGWRRVHDLVAVERCLLVELDGEPVAELTATPEDLEELAVGHLVATGLLPPGARSEDLGLRCVLEDGGRKASVTTALSSWPTTRRCAEPPPPARVEWTGSVEPARLTRLADTLETSPLFAETGATHSALAAPAAPESPDRDWTVHREDIGRHNAVDKVIGRLWLDGRLAREPLVLATSGRVWADLVVKAARTGIPVIVSRGAATDRAVCAAVELGLTLVGFARDGRMNVYAGEERLAAAAGGSGPGRRGTGEDS